MANQHRFWVLMGKNMKAKFYDYTDGKELIREKCWLCKCEMEMLEQSIDEITYECPACDSQYTFVIDIYRYNGVSRGEL